MDTSMIVNIAITAVVALFVLAGMFWGMVRGLKKTAIRGVWLLVTAGILMLFLSGVITNAILNMSFTYTYEGVEVHNLSELISAMIDASGADVSAFGDSIAVAVETIIRYIALLLNAFTFVILFWILKIVLLPVNWALSKWVFLSKRERQYRADVKEYKRYKKAMRGKPKMEVMAFAVNDDEVYVEEVKEVTEAEKKSKGFASLSKARSAFDDMRIRSEQLKGHTYQETTQETEANQLLDRPYQEPQAPEVEKVVEEKVKVEFQPKDEHKPKSEKKEEKVEEFRVTKKPKKLKKHRMLGMLVGGILGLFIAGITLSPAIGILSLADDINASNEIELENGTKQGMIDYLTEGMFSEINNYYKDAIGTNILTYSGSKWVATTTFNALTSGKIDGVDANFTKDIAAIMAVVNEVNTITTVMSDTENNSYNQVTMDKLLRSAEKIVDKLFDISIISILTPHIIELAANMLEQEISNQVIIKADSTSSEGDSIINDDDLKDILTTAVAALRKVDTADKLELELKSLVYILKTLNCGVVLTGETSSTSLLAEMMKNMNDDSESQMIRTIQKLNYDYYKTNNSLYFTYLINNFYEYQGYEPIVANSILPKGVDLMLKLLLRELEMEEVADALTALDNNSVKEFVINTFDNAFTIMLEINTTYDSSGNITYIEYSEDTISEIGLSELNETVFRSLGKIIDGVANMVDDDTYATILDKLATAIAESMEGVFASMLTVDDAKTLSGNIGNAIKTFGTETTFEKELVSISEMFDYLLIGKTVVDEEGNETVIKPLIESKDGKYTFGNAGEKLSNVMNDITNLEQFGKVVNAMQEVKIFSYKAEDQDYNNLTFLLNGFLQKTKTDIKAELDAEVNEVITLTANGFVNEPTTTNGLLYNIINGLQRNVTNNIKENGAYDWATGFGDTPLYSGVMADINEAGDSIFDFSSTNEGNNIIDILLENNTEVMVGYDKVYYCLLDYIKVYSLFDGVLTRLFNDLQSVAEATLSEDDFVMKDEIISVFNTVIGNLSGTASSNADKSNTFYNQLTILNNAITPLNEMIDEFGSEDIEINKDTLAKLGRVLDKLTATQGSSRLLEDKDVNNVVVGLLDSEVLGENGVLSGITDESIKEPLEKLLNVIKERFDNNTISKEVQKTATLGKWERIMSAVGELMETSFDDMNTIEGAMNSVGTILDTMTGREKSGNAISSTGVKLATDDDVKEFLIAVIANYVGGDENIDGVFKNVVFANNNNAKLNALITAIDGDGEKYQYFDSFDTNDGMSGVLENLYNLTIDARFSWTKVCDNLSDVVDIQDITLGNFDNADGKHSFYDETKVATSGIGLTLDNMLAADYTLVNIAQVKYIINNQLDFEESGYTKGLSNTIKGNVNKISSSTQISFDNEFRTVQYLIDIGSENSADNVDVTQWGVYLDEIEGSVLLDGVGEVVVGNALDEIVAETEDMPDQNIGQPITRLLTAVNNNFASVVADTNNTWTKIFAAFDKITDIEFSALTEIGNALDSVANMLDILTGRPFKNNSTDETTISVEFVGDMAAKEFLIGIIANNIGANATMGAEIKQIIYNVSGANSDFIDRYNALIYVPEDSSNDEKAALQYFTIFNGTTNVSDMTGVLQQLDRLTTTADDFTWTAVCGNLKQLVQIEDVNLGKFAGDTAHTLYTLGNAEVAGVGAKLDTILAEKYTILNISHVKYLIKQNVVIDDSAKSYIKNVVDDIKANVDNLTAGTLDTEFKSVQYLIDIASATTGNAAISTSQIGVHLDEINTSVLVGNIGISIANNIIDTIVGDSADEEFEDIRAKIAEVDAVLNAFKGTTDVRYFFVADNIKANMAASSNTEIFGAIESIKNEITSIEIGESISETNTIELSKKLYVFQDNILLGIRETRYLAIFVIEGLVSLADVAGYSSNVNNNYTMNNNYKQYLSDNFESNIVAEHYADDANGTMSEFNNAADDYKYYYIVQRVMNDIGSVLGSMI